MHSWLVVVVRHRWKEFPWTDAVAPCWKLYWGAGVCKSCSSSSSRSLNACCYSWSFSLASCTVNVLLLSKQRTKIWRIYLQHLIGQGFGSVAKTCNSIYSRFTPGYFYVERLWTNCNFWPVSHFILRWYIVAMEENWNSYVIYIEWCHFQTLRLRCELPGEVPA